MTAIEGYDLVMIGILLFAAVLGYFKGIVWQLAWIAGIVVSSFVALRFGPEVEGYFGEQPPWNRLLAMLALYAGTSIIVWLVFRIVSRAIDAIHLSSFDHQLGLLFGAAKGMLLCMILTFFAVTLAPAYREQIVTSRSGQLVADLLAQADAYLPPNLHDAVAPYLDRFEAQLHGSPVESGRPSAQDATVAGESPLSQVWQGVQSVAAWAGVEPGANGPGGAPEQGGVTARQAGGPLPEGSSWFAAPPQTPPPPLPSQPQPATVAPGGYRVGTQSPLPQRW